MKCENVQIKYVGHVFHYWSNYQGIDSKGAIAENTLNIFNAQSITVLVSFYTHSYFFVYTFS